MGLTLRAVTASTMSPWRDSIRDADQRQHGAVGMLSPLLPQFPDRKLGMILHPLHSTPCHAQGRPEVPDRVSAPPTSSTALRLGLGPPGSLRGLRTCDSQTVGHTPFSAPASPQRAQRSR